MRLTPIIAEKLFLVTKCSKTCIYGQITWVSIEPERYTKLYLGISKRNSE